MRDTVVSRALSSLYGGSLEITLSVPFYQYKNPKLYLFCCPGPSWGIKNKKVGVFIEHFSCTVRGDYFKIKKDDFQFQFWFLSSFFNSMDTQKQGEAIN